MTEEDSNSNLEWGRMRGKEIVIRSGLDLLKTVKVAPSNED